MRVLIVDDHPLFRAGLKALLFELDAKIDAAEASTLADVLEARERGETFDLVLLDVNLPDATGLRGLEQVKDAFEAALVVVMSAVEDADLIFSAVDAGACGYIPKTTDPTVTVNALRLVLARGIYLPPNVLQDREKSLMSGGAEESVPQQPYLSQRQLEVLQRLLHGKPNKIIARDLGIAQGTVKAHLAAIYQALRVTSRSEAMYRAHELGFFEQFAKLPR